MVHDIGLTAPHLEYKGCKCFTQESADQFAHSAEQINFDQAKIALTKDAICMHMNGYIDPSHPKEVILLQQGASCDVIGQQLHQLPAHFKQKILDQYPRENFNQTFTELINAESRKHANLRTAFLKKMGLALLIHLNPDQN